ncbi:MAG TPA: ATP-dependent DNA helicase RecG [Solirubrobacterales bacterium]|nr:ATP-dependent DNA helicase RecG [Solirubrobacterales bacterium]
MEAALDHRPEPAAVYVPRAPGSGEPLERDRLLAAPLKTMPRPSVLDAPITKLRGAGPKLSGAAAEIGIGSLGDLLRHLPHGYRDRAQPVGLAALRLGEEATVEVEVIRARVRPTRRRRLTILEADVRDTSGQAKAIWFNRAWLAERLRPGTRLLLHGKLEKRGLNVSEHEFLGSGADAGLHTTGIVPVHPASERVRPQRIREWAWQAIPQARHAVEPIPGRLRRELRLAAAEDALVASHFPADEHAAEAARERLAFEELFLYQAALVSRRGRRMSGDRGQPIPERGQRVDAWLGSLPFELTGDQRRAIEEIDEDLAETQPMQRLLMGEVGSGKTVVALYAMLRAIEAGHQAALMAPTETLAEQHFRTLGALLASMKRDSPRSAQSTLTSIPATLLTSATPAGSRRELLRSLAAGQPQLVVGTHALIEETVEFSSLAVAVVDEQHRFGVRQRSALDAKGPGERLPHVLHMTATPIPRTLSLTAYGDLDTTVLRELPAGRQPITTRVVDEESRPPAYEFIRNRLREGRQAFVVCPLVADSESVQAKAAEAEAKRLAAGELRDFRVALLHGQMSSEGKAGAMDAFASGVADVLVATTVIEVGIDVPNATVMLVEGAERFGLSQLHQLRGRVGRGEHPSFCILFGDPESDAARARLDAIARESDGFALAEVDLSIRGEGEILGTRQHGLPRFRAATLPEDTALLLEARRRVLELRERHGSLEADALGPLMDEARRRFGDERREQIAA